MSGLISTAIHPRLLQAGVNEVWGLAYNQYPTQYTDLFEQLTSDKAYEEDVAYSAFGLAQLKGQGQPYANDSEAQGAITRYNHLSYALGFMVTQEEIEDNLYMKLASSRAKSNAFSMNQTIENVAAGIYNGAFSSTFYTTGDGQPLLSASHPNITGGTYSNLLSPGADLSELALEDLTIQIMAATNDRGLQISLKPRSLHVSRNEWFEACRILMSVQQSNTADNNINVLNATGTFPGGAKVNQYFTNPSAWFIRTDCPDGMKMFWRKKVTFGTDNDFETMVQKNASHMRFSVGCTDPRSIYGSQGA